MWGVEDGGGEHGAVDTAVGDGEDAALEVIDGDFAFADFFGVVDDFFFDIGEGELIAVTDDWDHEALGSADGYTDVIEMVLDDVIAVDLGVDFRCELEGLDGGFDEEGHEAEFDAVFFEEFFLVFFAGIHDGAHIDFVEGGEHGGFLFGGDEAFCDFFAQGGHFFAGGAGFWGGFGGGRGWSFSGLFFGGG